MGGALRPLALLCSLPCAASAVYVTCVAVSRVYRVSIVYGVCTALYLPAGRDVSRARNPRSLIDWGSGVFLDSILGAVGSAYYEKINLSEFFWQTKASVYFCLPLCID